MLLYLVLSTVLATTSGRTVTGTVTELSGEPARGALVLLRTTLPTGATTRRATTDDAGRFRINGVIVGPHTLRVNANGFLRPDPISFVLREDDASRDIRVVVASDGIVRAVAEGDAKGRAVVATPAGSVTLYVIGNDGAFGIRRLAAA